MAVLPVGGFGSLKGVSEGVRRRMYDFGKRILVLLLTSPYSCALFILVV